MKLIYVGFVGGCVVAAQSPHYGNPNIRTSRKQRRLNYPLVNCYIAVENPPLWVGKSMNFLFYGQFPDRKLLTSPGFWLRFVTANSGIPRYPGVSRESHNPQNNNQPLQLVAAEIALWKKSGAIHR